MINCDLYIHITNYASSSFLDSECFLLTLEDFFLQISKCYWILFWLIDQWVGWSLFYEQWPILSCFWQILNLCLLVYDISFYKHDTLNLHYKIQDQFLGWNTFYRNSKVIMANNHCIAIKIICTSDTQEIVRTAKRLNIPLGI